MRSSSGVLIVVGSLSVIDRLGEDCCTQSTYEDRSDWRGRLRERLPPEDDHATDRARLACKMRTVWRSNARCGESFQGPLSGRPPRRIQSPAIEVEMEPASRTG